jgi:acetyl-CoA C-acetyltransferase
MVPARPASVIVAAARTPVGKFGGALRDMPAVDLGAVAIRTAVGRAATKATGGSVRGDPEALGQIVDYVLMGHVLQAGLGQNTARQAAVAAGLPAHVPAMTLNKVCLASISAIALADQLIRAGEIEVAVAGGMESMSTAPHVLTGCRWGAHHDDVHLVDPVVHDGLWSAFSDEHMGQSSDRVNAELGISRAAQDAWAARSHQRAAAAWAAGRFAEETVVVGGPDGLLASDEGIRSSTTTGQLAVLPPAFTPGGTITAGNSSQLSDGAAAVVVMSRERADGLGFQPLVEIAAHGMCADQFTHLHTVPATALQRALKKAGMDLEALGLIEINEAFASVALHAAHLLGADEQVVNVNGGAVAIGHPLGSTGARMTVTLLHEMARRGADAGGVTLCGGGGQGDALVLRRLA